MRIEFKQRLLSIKSLDGIDLPNFVVLTGLNGSGKSHLLKAINGGQITVTDTQVIPPNDVFLTSYRDMKLESLRSHDVDAFWNIRQKLVSTRETVRSTAVIERAQIYKNYGLDASELATDSPICEPSKSTLEGLHEPLRQQFVSQLEALGAKYVNTFGQAFPGGANAQNQTLARLVQDRLGKPLVDASEGDFRWKIPAYYEEVSLLNNAFSQEFGNYIKLKEQNQYHQFRNSNYSENNDTLTDVEFLEVHGNPPWELANDVFRAASIPAMFDEPPSIIAGTFSATLRHTRSGEPLDFTSLSSGEQVLAILALSVYRRRSKTQKSDLPKVLLLDEIDAPLHPSMVQRLIDTVQDVFVGQHSMHVVLATHSPTTVALSPESAIFEMNAEEPRVRKISQQSALRILCTGLPTLSVRVEERRPVFVESDNDVRYYENLFDSLYAQAGSLAYSPQFLSTSSKPGSGDLTGSDRVKTLTKKLSDSGVDQIRGLVDGDGCNVPESPIIAVGSARRYGIENYILDPLLIGLYITKMQYNSKVKKEDLGLTDQSDVWGGLDDKDDSALQRLIDGVIAKVSVPDGKDKTLVLCKLVGGASVSIPKWICSIQGHEWEALLKASFPELNKYRSEAALKSAVIAHVCRAKPHLTSEDLIETFQELLS